MYVKYNIKLMLIYYITWTLSNRCPENTPKIARRVAQKMLMLTAARITENITVIG